MLSPIQIENQGLNCIVNYMSGKQYLLFSTYDSCALVFIGYIYSPALSKK